MSFRKTALGRAIHRLPGGEHVLRFGRTMSELQFKRRSGARLEAGDVPRKLTLENRDQVHTHSGVSGRFTSKASSRDVVYRKVPRS